MLRYFRPTLVTTYVSQALLSCLSLVILRDGLGAWHNEERLIQAPPQTVEDYDGSGGLG